MPLFDERKTRITKEELATLLCHWLSKDLSKEQLNLDAEMFSIDISEERNFSRFFGELFDLNMWLVIHSCERVIEDVNKRNECLDIFHKLVYQAYQQVRPEEDFNNWLTDLANKYSEYNNARDSEQEPGPVFALASLVNKNIFGKLNLDVFVHFAIGNYVNVTIQTLEGTLRHYNVS